VFPPLPPAPPLAPPPPEPLGVAEHCCEHAARETSPTARMAVREPEAVQALARIAIGPSLMKNLHVVHVSVSHRLIDAAFVAFQSTNSGRVGRFFLRPHVPLHFDSQPLWGWAPGT
jgi:hypothetical protein